MLKLTYTCDLPGRWVARDERGQLLGYIDTDPLFSRFTPTVEHLPCVSELRVGLRQPLEPALTFGEAANDLTNFWARRRLQDAGLASPLHEHFAR